MESVHKLKLQKCYDTIVDQIEANDLTPILISNMVINLDDREEIVSKGTRKSRAETLMAMLPNRGPKAYGALRQALLKYYNWLVPLLDNCEIDTATNVGIGDVKGHYTDFDVTTEVCLKIAGHAEVMKHWKMLGRHLQLSDGDIANIEYAERERSEMVYQVLQKWRERKGLGKHGAELARVLSENLHCKDLADELMASGKKTTDHQ